MNRLSEKSLEEIEAELATAQQEATKAKKRVEDITNELTTNQEYLVPINSENASNLEKIDRLKTQLSTAQQQAQEAEQKYQSELNKAKTATGVSVFTGMFEDVSTPPPPPSLPISRNGRCGPAFNNTKCPGNQCCSFSGWCSGDRGTYSAWCFANWAGNVGRDNGIYDGAYDGPLPSSVVGAIPEDTSEWDGVESFAG
jgi:hypothetical protein